MSRWRATSPTRWGRRPTPSGSRPTPGSGWCGSPRRARTASSSSTPPRAPVRWRRLRRPAPRTWPARSSSSSRTRSISPAGTLAANVIDADADLQAHPTVARVTEQPRTVTRVSFLLPCAVSGHALSPRARAVFPLLCAKSPLALQRKIAASRGVRNVVRLADTRLRRLRPSNRQPSVTTCENARRLRNYGDGQRAGHELVDAVGLYRISEERARERLGQPVDYVLRLIATDGVEQGKRGAGERQQRITGRSAWEQLCAAAHNRCGRGAAAALSRRRSRHTKDDL